MQARQWTRLGSQIPLHVSFIFALVSLFNLQVKLFVFFEGAHFDFQAESIRMRGNCLLGSFWKCELNFNTFVLFKCKASEIYSAKFRNGNNYANRHTLLRESRSKKTKIIIADLTCNKKTYPLNFRRELKPNSSLKADKYRNKTEGIAACACKWFSCMFGQDLGGTCSYTRNALSAWLELTCSPESQKIRQSCGVLLSAKFLLTCIQT